MLISKNYYTYLLDLHACELTFGEINHSGQQAEDDGTVRQHNVHCDLSSNGKCRPSWT